MSQLVRYHCLEDFVLGRFTISLRELHRSLWQERISTFTQRRFSELVHLHGYGEVRICQSVSLILGLAFLLSTLPAHSDIRIAVLPATIAQANRWLVRLLFLEHEKLPDSQSIREDFLRPLLEQVEKDIGARVSEVTRRRIGEGSEPASLREISKDYGVTPDRIRTLIQQAAFVYHVRWPEGRYLLQGVCAELSARRDASIQQQILQRIHQVFFLSRKVRSNCLD